MITLDILKSHDCSAELVHRFKYEFKNGCTALELVESLRDHYLLPEALIKLGAVLDVPGVDDLILDASLAFLYCKHVNDTKAMRNKIDDDYFRYLYCIQIKGDESMRKMITNAAVLRCIAACLK